MLFTSGWIRGSVEVSPSSSRERTRAPLEHTVKPVAESFREFVNAQSASGWVMLSALLLALGIANSPLADDYARLLHMDLGILVGDLRVSMSLQHWVNDGLMALFFFLLGLELKRELLVGRLSELRNATGVLLAALGGMAVPGACYALLTMGTNVTHGWAIPVATDTAFALALLVLLGDRVPTAARAFLVGLAIIDDLGAILIIALVYTSDLNAAMFPAAAAAVGALVVFNVFGVRNRLPYLFVGVALWGIFLQLGLHGTFAGVVVALAAPVRPQIARMRFVEKTQRRLQAFEHAHDRQTEGIIEQPEQQQIAEDVLRVAVQATPPLSRWESHLEKPVSFLIVPIFAFCNAGIVLDGDSIAAAWRNQMSFAILAGLLIGKPLGILGGIGLGKLTGIASMPDGLSWRVLLGLGLLGGIGFTMSLFIANLSFSTNLELLNIAKQGVILTSIVAAIIGYSWLRWAPRENTSH